MTERVHAVCSHVCFSGWFVCLACWWTLSLGAETHAGHGAFCPPVVMNCTPKAHAGPGNSCHNPEYCHGFQKEMQTRLHLEPGLVIHVFFVTNTSTTDPESMYAKGATIAFTHTHTHTHTQTPLLLRPPERVRLPECP